jgi:hypothetical protein
MFLLHKVFSPLGEGMKYSISQARFQESCHILPHLLRFKVLDDLAIALDDFLLHV